MISEPSEGTPAGVTCRLERVWLMAKPFPASDFRLVPAEDRAVPAAGVVELAADWLQAHLDGGNAQTVTLVRRADGWWLLRSTLEPRTDNAGRLASSVAFGRLADPPSPEVLGAFLLGAYQEAWPSAPSPTPVELAVPIVSEACDEDCWLASMSLALELEPMAVVPSATALVWVARRLESAIDYLALFSRRLPSRLPKGRGLLVSSASWTPPEKARRLVSTLTLHESVDLAGLLRLGVELSRRAALLEAARGTGWPSAPKPSAGEALWLLGSPVSRERALCSAVAADLRSWLSAGLLRPDERQRVKESCLGRWAARSAAPSPEERERLRVLVQAGDIGESEVAEVVRRGGSPACLEAAGVEPGLVALLDNEAIPPMEPPRMASPPVARLLSEAVASREFWDRWPDGVPRPLADWLAELLQALPGGALVGALTRAADPATRLSAEWLKVLAPASAWSRQEARV